MDYAVILAGGVGSRFWPLSRKSLPKQFLRIMGNDTFLEATIKRVQTIIPRENIFIVTNQIYLQEIKRQLQKFRVPQENIILEPKPLNTLPAISLCAWLISRKDTRANLLVLPSDHYIKDNSGFKKTIVKALNLSAQDFLCLIGIKPDKPCLGYGYIQRGKKIGKGAYSVDCFIEKPSLNTIKQLLRGGGILWNSGIFCFKAEVILEEIKTYVPKLYAQMIKIKQKQDIKKIWPKIKANSIDYGLLEKANNLAMVQAEFYWRDLGSWDVLCSVLSKDRKNNIILADCINLDSTNILVSSYGSKRLIATVGLEGVIIIDTPDALLVCKKEKAQEIKRVVELLRQKRKKCV